MKFDSLDKFPTEDFFYLAMSTDGEQNADTTNSIHTEDPYILHICQPGMTKKDRHFETEVFIPPTEPRRLDNLVVNHIISY